MATCSIGSIENTIARGSSTEFQNVYTCHPVRLHSSRLSHWIPQSRANEPHTTRKPCPSAIPSPHAFKTSIARTLFSSTPLRALSVHRYPPGNAVQGERTVPTAIDALNPDVNTCSTLSEPPTSNDQSITTNKGSKALASAFGFLLALGLLSGGLSGDVIAEAAGSQQFTDMPALRGKDYGKTAMRYSDYVQTDSGLQYKDLREGSGPIPKEGQTVVIDWDGFTIGYYGRIFEARNKTKGGSFEGTEKEFYRFKIGSNKVIPAFEEAVATMKLGGVRRIVVPPEIGYPENNMDLKGPKPITFSGQRALDFVLKNQGMIDKTLLFDIELLRID